MGVILRWLCLWAYGAISAPRKLLTGLLVVLGLATPAAAETVTIAALGDSLTQGFGLPVDQGLVPQLESWLNAQGADVRLINAGVSGDTTQGGLSRVAWTLSDGPQAMIVALGGNDLLRGLDPAVSRANVTGILQAAAEADVEVLLVGMQAPLNYGQDYKDAFDALYPELAAEFHTLFVESFFGPLEDGGDLRAARQAYMQADGIHPNAEGVARIVEALGPDVLELVERVRAR